MKPRKASLALVLAGSLALSFAALAHADSTARVDAASAPAGTDPRLKVALRNSVSQRLTYSGLVRSLEGYSLSPSLVQLRSYVEAGQKQPRLVCIVGLTLSSERGVLADVRGSVVTIGTSQVSAIDAAAQAAVARLPAVLSQLQARDSSNRIAQR
ncbi:MAG TPA: hypothetical protein VHP33_08295 [Polyangiaceae bacterium]|nr:hypothetical protein [Polyangiaceae bacterium]